MLLLFMASASGNLLQTMAFSKHKNIHRISAVFYVLDFGGRMLGNKRSSTLCCCGFEDEKQKSEHMIQIRNQMELKEEKFAEKSAIHIPLI